MTASAHGLGVRSLRPLVPRAGKAALFSLFVLSHGAAATDEREPLVLRDAEGRRTPAEREVRRFFGLGTPDDQAPSPPRSSRAAR